MMYIAESFECPLGKVTKIWWRHKYQDATGNLSHIHSLIWIENECREDMLDRIRGSIGGVIQPSEVPGVIANGLLKNDEEAEAVREHARRVLIHTHSLRCLH